MLGIGIFISPPEVAANVSSPTSFLVMWFAGGLAALFGALSLAELAAMMPRDGGDYAYLRAGYGPGIAFAAGWLQLLAIFPGSLASVAFATASYQLPTILGPQFAEPVTLLGLTLPGASVWAAVIIVVLTAINYIGVRISGIIQVVVTSIPLVVLLGTGMYVLLADPVVEASGALSPSGSGGFSALAKAYLAVYFAYSGWNAVIYVGGEVENPARNLPRALVGGTGLVTGLYVLLCAGFLAVFGLNGLAVAGEAGTAAAKTIFGPVGILAMAGLIALAMLGSLNGSVLTGSRVAYAMAAKGDCVRAAGRLHPKFKTPGVALWMQAGISIALLATGWDLDELIGYTSSAMLITGTLTVFTVVILRRRLPKLKRPYKTWLYPLPPVLYSLSSVVVVVVLVWKRDASVWLAVAWFAAALAVHAIFFRNKKIEPRSVDLGDGSQL